MHLSIHFLSRSEYISVDSRKRRRHPFLRRQVDESMFREALDEYFAKHFRTFGILPDKNCEDRSLNDIQLNPNSSEECSRAGQRLVEEDEESQESETCLYLCYKTMIAPRGRERERNAKSSLCLTAPYTKFHLQH